MLFFYTLQQFLRMVIIVESLNLINQQNEFHALAKECHYLFQNYSFQLKYLKEDNVMR
jgi:hypothetical protein